MMAIVRAHVERVEVVGLDEAYLDLDGLFSPRAAMRRLVAEIKRRHAAHLLGGHRPEQARREGRLRRREAGRLRRARPASRRARASRASPPGLVPGIGPKTAARLAALGLSTLAALGAAARAAARRALRPEPRRRAGPARALRARRRGRRAAQGRLGVARAHLRQRHAAIRRAAARGARADGRGAVREPRRARAQRAHDRDQGAPRRLHDGHPRAHDRRQPTCDVELVGAVALRLLAATTPRRGRCACSACASRAVAATDAGGSTRLPSPPGGRARAAADQLALPL